ADNTCTPNPPLPTCDEACRSMHCARFFTGVEPTNGCGGNLSCGINHSRVTKSCTCQGEACTANGTNCATDAECCSNHCSNVMGTCNPDGTPILTNTDDNNPDYELTAAGDGVTCDIFADGRPVKLAWTNPASDVGFLALDRNGNGAIDSG